MQSQREGKKAVLCNCCEATSAGLPSDVYLAAFGQRVASSQQQDDVPGHFFVDNLPVQQSLWCFDLLS